MSASTLDLQLSLLRGETPSPMDLTSFGKPGAVRLKQQTKAAFSDRLAVRLLTLIASGRLEPGAGLPPERQLAESMAVSRVCVRTALDRLKNEGYLLAVQGSGTRVARNSETDSLARLLGAHAANRQDLAEICGYLDLWALKRAVIQGSAEQIEHMAQLLEAGAPAGWAAEHEVRLRLALADASHSPIFKSLMEYLVRALQSYFWCEAGWSEGGPQAQAMKLASHTLARALRLRDHAAAEQAMCERTALVARRAPQASAGLPPSDAAETRASLLQDLLITHPDQLRARLAREIAAMMVRQRLQVGDRLLSERRLADTFGVSRMSVREALALLKENGSITASGRSGTHAREQGGDTLEELSLCSPENFRDLCAIRHYLEAWSARRAAEAASDGDRSDLRRILSEMRRPIPAAQRQIDLDMKLHLTITRAAGSAVNLYITEVLRDAVSAYFDFALSDLFIDAAHKALLLEQHARIVGAIIERDAEGAEQAMAAHTQMFRDLFEGMQGPMGSAGMH